MKEKIEQRVIAFFVLMVAILVFVAYSALSTIKESIVSSDWVNKTHDFVTQVNAVISSLHAGDSALRTYLLTGDPRDQGAYRSAYSEMVEHLQTAKAMSRFGEESKIQEPSLKELEGLIKDRIDFTRNVVQVRQKQGLDQARDLLTGHPDVESIGKISRLTQNMIREENSLLASRDELAHLNAQATRTKVYTGVIVNFVLLGFVFWLLRDDLEARRFAATALEEANATLEAKVRERTAELSKSNDSLRQENLERRWSNQALDHQLRYSQLIINSIGEMVFVISRALNISRINPAVSHNTNWEPQDLVAQSLDRVLQPGADADAAGAPPQNPIAFGMRQGREIQDREAVLLTKSGQNLPVRYSMIPLRDQDKVVGAVITVRIPPGTPRTA